MAAERMQLSGCRFVPRGPIRLRPVLDEHEKDPVLRVFRCGAYRDRTGDLRLANTVIALENRLLMGRFWRGDL
jgi:hypothetical protein